MLIGTKDIAAWNAKQWNVTIGNHEIQNESEWLRGSAVPFLDRNTIGFKNVRVVLLIKDEGRETMIRDRSEILALLLEPAELTLDGFTNQFYGILEKYSFEESAGNRMDLWHKLTLEFSAYEFGQTVSETGSGSVTITNPGNLEGPAVIEITPTFGAASVTLTGVCRNPETGADDPVTIQNLETGKMIVLDGETGLITEDGENKAGDVDIWEMPTVLPGENTIVCSTDNVTITVKIKPRYM